MFHFPAYHPAPRADRASRRGLGAARRRKKAAAVLEALEDRVVLSLLPDVTADALAVPRLVAPLTATTIGVARGSLAGHAATASSGTDPTIDLNWNGGGVIAPAKVNNLQTDPVTVTRTYTVSGGNLTEPLTIAYYASPSGVYGAPDNELLGTETVTDPAALTAGTHAGTSPPLTFPGLGTRYVFAMLDPANTIAETDKTNNLAEAPGPVTVTGAEVIDDGTPGYSEQPAAGWWFTCGVPGGYGGHTRAALPGDGSATATWQFGGLPAGTYDVQATWLPVNGTADNTPYRIYQGATLLRTVRVNQQVAAAGGAAAGGVAFQHLAYVTTDSSGPLRVVVGNDADWYVEADAVQIVTVPTQTATVSWGEGAVPSPQAARTDQPVVISRAYTITGGTLTAPLAIAYYASASGVYGAPDNQLLGVETVTDPAQLTADTHAGTSPPLAFPGRDASHVFAVLDPDGALTPANAPGAVAEATLVVSTPTGYSNGPAFNVKAYGARGDGVKDDGPALQAALDALAAAGGGTVYFPRGTYAIRTGVYESFFLRASSVLLAGEGPGSVIKIESGPGSFAIWLNAANQMIVDGLTFVGTPGVDTDALVPLTITNSDRAVIRNSRFYGLSSRQAAGAVVETLQTSLSLESDWFYGCSGDRTAQTPIVQCDRWLGFDTTDVHFVDQGVLGSGPAYDKVSDGRSYAAILLNSGAPSPWGNPRAVISRTDFGAGNFNAIVIDASPATVSSVVIADARIDGSSIDGGEAIVVRNVDRLAVARTSVGLSGQADGTAVDLAGVGVAELDAVDLLAGQDTIAAAGSVGLLWVRGGTYAHLNDAAAVTRVEGPAGMLAPPAMTSGRRDALAPAAGWLIWNTTLGALQVYDGAAWRTVAAS